MDLVRYAFCAFLSVFIISAYPNSNWMNQWVEGCDKVKRGEFNLATDLYTNSIEILGDDVVHHLHLFNERGMVYSSLNLDQKAIDDYSKVINRAGKIDSDVISAWWGRFKCYAKLNDLEQCDLHYKTLQEIDPSFPCVEFEDEYIIIKSQETITEQVRKQISKRMRIAGICENDDDVTVSPSGICIVRAVKFLNKLKPCNYLPNNKPCNSTSASIERCKNNCTSAAYYAGFICANLPKVCRFVCLGGLEPLRRACEWCCNSGNFYQECIEPIAKYTTIPCDPAWED